MRPCIGIVGAGQIGGTCGLLAMTSNLADVVFVDVMADFAKGKALDLNQATYIQGFTECSASGSGDYSTLAKCDIVIVTAGVPRKPGMTRDDLLAVNKKISISVAEGIKKNGNQPFVILTTNPLDVMVMVFQEHAGIPAHKVIGMAGQLDVARFKSFLAAKLQVAAADIRGVLMGGHGDLMVPVISHTSVNGVPLSWYVKHGKITEAEIAAVVQRTRVGGAEIVQLLGNGSAFYAPAAACIQMARSILHNERLTVSACVQLEGQYGYKGVYGGVPCVLGTKGVEEILELDLSADEKKNFDASMKAIADLKAASDKL